MIDEKELIKELRRHLLEYKKDDIAIGINVVKEIISKQSQIDRWIPCSKRLPTMKECQENDCRFILDDGNRRYQGYFDYIEKKFVYFNLDGMQIDKCAIAWQSLPEEYKEDTN